MNQLSADWLTRGLIDFEYKKYVLLAYLQHVSRNFDERKLYPFLGDLVQHYNNLIVLRQNKTLVSKGFPQQISKVDLVKFTIEYERMIADESCMAEVEAILDFAIPQVHSALIDGKDIYNDVEEHLKIFPVGLLSLNPEQGYLMLAYSGSKETFVYNYRITIFESAMEKCRGIRTDFIGAWQKSFSNTYEEIKSQVLKLHGYPSTCAAYGIEAQEQFPLDETLLPVAKRLLVRYVSGAVDA